MKSSGTFNLQRVFKAGTYSLQGIKACFQHEAAFRQETLLCVILIPLALYIGKGPMDYLLTIGSLLFVLLIEILNSAIEAVVDRIGDEVHELSGRAKDMGSAAVTIAIILAALCWWEVISAHLFPGGF
ncbi:diacylglycerol kinase (ATP) [Sinobacterium caligoides]|uniref:Diacylglycerol kinase n=1 Tax=Sinobacterium caligoides TaxID=933926 RepID=A0A3N2DK84_9GAMM|nr:diacylglycerol kinase [Sinobacterium caligoides]ROS00223.1 diacylglycerol kinase (ATP) [Sinobacterium caligoides]